MSENKKALAICKHKYRVEMFWLLIQSDLVTLWFGGRWV